MSDASKHFIRLVCLPYMCDDTEPIQYHNATGGTASGILVVRKTVHVLADAFYYDPESTLYPYAIDMPA